MTPRFTRHAGAAIAIALHAAAGVALLNYEPARAALLAAAPIMVELIAPAPIPAAEPEPEVKPRPRPIAKRPKPVEPRPVIAAPAQAPSPVVIAPPPPPPPPAPQPVVVAPPPPAPVTQPVFDADYLENPAPPYPQLSRRTREEGRVVLRVLVTPRGTADEVQVRTSSGHARLDESARETVRRWKFIPAKRGAEPIAAWVLVPISFGLDS
ncbi:MAG TPA: energy transducer TonB [Burkholderiales bacterium]|nr:energy transducer TonB [Burkholderiales bacterium]